MLFFACENVHTALYALFHHFAGHFVRLVDVALEIIIISRASAAANKLSKTISAVLSRKQTGRREFFPYIFIENAVEHVAH